jgi:hypothetical protein
MRTTKQLLGSGGDYETVPVMVCRNCGALLEINAGPEGIEDGEAD